MISKVEDYEYVVGDNIDDEHPHGDMDRILINGEIMPLRTGVSATTDVEAAKIMRGEDICFILEWLLQMWCAIETYSWPSASAWIPTYETTWETSKWHSPQTTTFRRVVGTLHAESSSIVLAQTLASRFVNTSMHWWFGESQIIGKYITGTTYDSARSAILANFYNPRTFDLTDIEAQDYRILKQSQVQAFYMQNRYLSSLAMMTRLEIDSYFRPALDMTYADDYPGVYHPSSRGWHWSRFYDLSHGDGAFVYGWSEEFCFPRAGQPLAELVVHHARRVVLMIVYTLTGAKGDVATVFEPYDMTASTTAVDTWALTTTDVWGPDASGKIGALASQTGLSTESPYEDEHGVTCYRNIISATIGAVPFVMFDDHTSFSA